MASTPLFRIVASDTTTAADTLLVSSSDAQQQQEQLLQRVWTITSTQQLQTLHVKVPGRVFIDYDSTLSPSRAAAVSLETTDSVEDASTINDVAPSDASVATPLTPTATVVAKIVVTSSSQHLLDDLLEVVPLYGAKEDKGVRFRVTNQSATLRQCAVLTQIYVSAASGIRELLSNGADVVIGEHVLVQHDADATLEVKSINHGDVFLKATSGFTLAGFGVSKRGTGTLQVQTPSLDVSSTLNAVCGHERASVLLAADSVRAKTMFALAMMAPIGTRVVTNDLAVSDTLMIWSGLGGSVTIAGNGTSTHHFGIAGAGGRINTVDIVSDNVTALIQGGGSIAAQPKHKLHACAIFAGRVEYAGERPDIVTESTWFRWQRFSGALVTPYNTAVDQTGGDDVAHANGTASALALRTHPPREPKVVDVRVSKSLFCSEPKLETDDELANAASRHWAWTLASSAAVVTVAAAAVVVVAAKQKRS